MIYLGAREGRIELMNVPDYYTTCNCLSTKDTTAIGLLYFHLGSRTKAQVRKSYATTHLMISLGVFTSVSIARLNLSPICWDGCDLNSWHTQQNKTHYNQHTSRAIVLLWNVHVPSWFGWTAQHSRRRLTICIPFYFIAISSARLT